MIAPNTDITFCNVPWPSDLSHVCDNVKESDYSSMAILTTLNYSYQRQDNLIRVGCKIDDIIGANYVVYRNINHENKLFCAFIERIVYVNDGRTDVYIKTDPYQTWKNNMSVKQAFVIREHVNDDTIGAHTFPESIEFGELYPCKAYSSAGLDDLSICILYNEVYDGDFTPVTAGMYHGIFTGGIIRVWHTFDKDSIGAFLAPYISEGHQDAIVAIFMVPTLFVSGASDGGLLPTSYSCPFESVVAPTRPTTINGYTPKNNKLFTFPYVCLQAHNNNGSAQIYRYEDFTGTPEFIMYGSVLPNPTFKLYPISLKYGYSADYDNSLTIGSYPICSWSSGVYQGWLAQNAGSIVSQIAEMGAGAAVGGAIANVPGAIAGAAISALRLIGQMWDASKKPSKFMGSLNAGSANCEVELNDFILQPKTIKAEYAKIIDDYFTRFGYAVNRVKTPNLTGRANWNYVQCIDPIITGGIPINDKKQLEQMLKTGVTIWHSTSAIGNYSLSNGVV